jgi:hypothetical protein
MNLIDDKLSGDEKIVYRARHHWAILLGPILVIIIGGLALGSQGYHALAVIAFGLIWGICSYISFRRSEIGLTGTRMLIDVGFPLKKSYEIALGEIVFIDFYQPSLGAMLDFGKIIIIDKGKKRRAFRLISHPAEFVRVVQQLIVALTPVSTVP